MSTKYDVIIIGSGAGGGTLARHSLGHYDREHYSAVKEWQCADRLRTWRAVRPCDFIEDILGGSLSLRSSIPITGQIAQGGQFLRFHNAANILRTIVFIALVALVSISVASAADDIKAFPAAEEGMTRQVINLPKQPDESAFKVELIIGKTVKTDATNSYFFAGTLETENIPGWGFDRYILRKLGPMAGTLMAVDPNASQVERFIGIGGEARLLRYNSRLPIVVYVPAGVEVRYRLWRAEPTVARAEGG